MKSSTKPKKPNRQPKKKLTLPVTKGGLSIDFRKQVLPILVGCAVAAVVFGIFNSQLLFARLDYYFYEHRFHPTISESQIISAPINKNAPSKIVIGSIGVNAPVVYSVDQIDDSVFLQALHSGVVHYPGTALPGQAGNVVVFGHSSGLWWAPGDYKFIFTLLDKVKSNDLIFIEYKGVRYIYRVYNNEVVSPTDLSPLDQTANSHTLTVITCTPVGTSTNRLIVRARQIVPKPTIEASSGQPTLVPVKAKGLLPSGSSSFWQNLKDLTL